MAVLKKIRIGTDITLGITVMASGHAVDWNSQDIKHGYAFSDIQGQPVAEMSYEQRGSTLRCVFHAEDQNYVGAYRVIIEFNDGSAFSSTLDMPAFELVRTSEEADIDTGEIVLDIDGSMRFYSLAEVISKLAGLHTEVKAAASAAREASDNANEAAKTANDAAALANSNASKAEASNKVINDNERKRIAQETARESAEADRKRAELERQKGDESIANKEAERERNEEVRETNEQTREDNELERRNAESARDRAEAQRATSETSRISNETSRQAAENKRVAAETSRKEAEASRVNVESERVTEFARLKKESEEATTAASAVSGVVAQHTAKITKIEELLQEGYTFMGVETSGTNPGTPDQKVFYIANGKGTYANFGGLIVDEDEVIILYYDTGFHKLLSGIASQTKLTELESEVINSEAEIATNNKNQVIEINSWLDGGYDSSGNVILDSVSYIKRTSVDISPYQNKVIGVKVSAYAMIWCGFEDAEGNLLQVFQTSESIRGFVRLIVPSTATKLFISTDTLQIKTEEVRVFSSDNAEIGTEDYISAPAFSNKLPLLSKNLSIFGKANEYIRYNSATATGVATGYAYGIAEDLIGGSLYEFLSFDIAAPSATDNIIRFLDANNKLCKWTPEYTNVGNGVSNGSTYNIFIVNAPVDAVKAEYNFYIKHSALAFFKKVYQSGDLEQIKWLGVTSDNFTPQSFKKMGDKLVFAPYFADVINKPISFNGKKLVAFGDSITFGFTSGSTKTENPYIKLLCDRAGATLTNRAVGGSTLVHRQSTDIVDRITTYKDAADIIWIAGGTNDFCMVQPIGQWGDTGTDSVYGAMTTICEYLKNNYPNAEVIFVTPIPYTKEKKNSLEGFTILDYYRKAIYEVATYYGYSVINGKGLGMPNEESEWATSMTLDGQHPTELGHSLMAKALCGKLL